MSTNTYTPIEQQKDRYLHHCLCTKRLSDLTVSAYEIDLHQFLEFLESRYPDHTCGSTISKTILQEYILFMNDHYKVPTVKRKVASLKGFFNWLADEEIVETSPFLQIHLHMKEPKRLPNVLTFREMNRILKAAYNDKTSISDFLYYRDIAILEVLFETGLRVHELCNLKYSDCDFRSHTFRIIGKGNKERKVYLTNPDSIIAFENYIRTVRKYHIKSEYIFLSKYSSPLSTQAVRILVDKYTKLAGIKRHITPHAFRHTFASLLLDNGVELKYIQEFLGHSSITTTQIYLHLRESTSKKILKNKHPRGQMKL